jgi:multidrug efflux pump subunit AcrA (membrane-fusion protein)
MGLCACAANANAENLPDLDCLLEPNMTVELSSPVPGVIDSIMVDRSDAVSKDQVLASLMADVEQEKYNMALAKAHYQGDLESSKVNLKLSEKESRRATELYRERAIALNEKEQAIAKLELARFELDKAMHDNEVFELELNEARANLELRQIRSPIDGVVVDRYMMPGEFVDNKPVLKVAQLNPLRVEVISQVANFGRIKPGMHAYVIPEFGEYDKLVAEVAVVEK